MRHFYAPAPSAAEELAPEDVKFYGLVVNEPLIVRAYAPPPPADDDGDGEGEGGGGGPNFKRFRKAPLLPSSNNYGLLVEYVKDACGGRIEKAFADEHQKRVQARYAACPAAAVPARCSPRTLQLLL